MFLELPEKSIINRLHGEIKFCCANIFLFIKVKLSCSFFRVSDDVSTLSSPTRSGLKSSVCSKALKNVAEQKRRDEV